MKTISIVLFVFAFSVIFFGVASHVAVLADSGDSPDTGTNTSTHHESSDAQEKQQEQQAYDRQVSLDAQPYEFSIESQLQSGNLKDHIHLGLSLGEDAPQIELQYTTSTNTSQTELAYRVEFQSIIEFLANSTGGFQSNQTVSTYNIGDAGWNPMNYSYVNGVHIIKATTKDNVFTLLLKLSDTIVQSGNVTLTPNALKIDVIINNFPYNRSDTSLALATKVKTGGETHYENSSQQVADGFAKDEQQLSVNTTAASGFFSWADKALADGNAVNVIHSNIVRTSNETDLGDGETATLLLFAFNAVHPKNITWDPRIGVISQGTQALINSIKQAYASKLSAGGFLPGFTWIITIATLALAMVIIRVEPKVIRKK